MSIDTGPLTKENVDQQFCSDWLTGEIKKLFEKNAVLEELVELYGEGAEATLGLEKARTIGVGDV